LKKCLKEILEKIFFLKKNCEKMMMKKKQRRKETEKISFKKGTKRNCELFSLSLSLSLSSPASFAMS
jgi:hypothetical protein